MGEFGEAIGGLVGRRGVLAAAAAVPLAAIAAGCDRRTPARRVARSGPLRDGSVQARYTHVTATMRRTLLDGLTGVWEAALEERRMLAPSSPVAVLDALLRKDG